MALQRNTLVEPYDYISQHDPAVDHDVENFDERWKQYRDGVGEPPLKAGEKPTIFTLRHLTPTERVYLFELSRGDERGIFITAAGLGLVRVQNLETADGKPLVVVQEATQVGTARLRHATKASLDALPMDVLLELGALVIDRSAVRPSS